MSYTTQDLANIRQAILDLATGQRVVSFTSANGKSTTFGQTDLVKLEALERRLSQKIGGKLSRTRRVITSKGL